jgi:hypothetical protein
MAREAWSAIGVIQCEKCGQLRLWGDKCLTCTPPQRRYLDDHGREVFVGVVSTEDGLWGAYVRQPGGKLTVLRKVPHCFSEGEAQGLLDAVAAKRGWEAASGQCVVS